MGAIDLECGKKSRGVVGEEPRRIGTGRLVTLAGAARVERDASEMLGVVPHLEGIPGVVGCQIRNQQQRLARALLFGIHGDGVYLYFWHGPSSPRFSAKSSRWMIPQKRLAETDISKMSDPSACLQDSISRVPTPEKRRGATWRPKWPDFATKPGLGGIGRMVARRLRSCQIYVNVRIRLK